MTLNYYFEKLSKFIIVVKKLMYLMSISHYYQSIEDPYFVVCIDKILYPSLFLLTLLTYSAINCLIMKFISNFLLTFLFIYSTFILKVSLNFIVFGSLNFFSLNKTCLKNFFELTFLIC